MGVKESEKRRDERGEKREEQGERGERREERGERREERGDRREERGDGGCAQLERVRFVEGSLINNESRAKQNEAGRKLSKATPLDCRCYGNAFLDTHAQTHVSRSFLQ